MPHKNPLERFLLGLHRFEIALLALVLISMVLIATLQIILRNFFDTGLIWIDPLLRTMLLWLGLLGAVAASHDDKHIAIDLLSRTVPDRWRPWVRMLTSLFTAVICSLVAYYSFRFVVDDYHYQTPSNISDAVPAWTVEVIIPLAFILIALRYYLLVGRYGLHKRVGNISS